MKQYLKYSLYSLAILLLSACDSAPKIDRQLLIDEALEKKIVSYKEAHRNNCQKEIIRSAKEIVDSTLLANARNYRVMDSIVRPLKPIKPAIPEAKALEDTLPLKPILELPVDSLEAQN